ncbi:MAG: hypothetical protein L0Z68_04965 [Gammaproteobacteria bacterium]|nr:hypothetical protein [Gammaproteobacteria bacterium]
MYGDAVFSGGLGKTFQVVAEIVVSIKTGLAIIAPLYDMLGSKVRKA